VWGVGGVFLGGLGVFWVQQNEANTPQIQLLKKKTGENRGKKP